MGVWLVPNAATWGCYCYDSTKGVNRKFIMLYFLKVASTVYKYCQPTQWHWNLYRTILPWQLLESWVNTALLPVFPRVGNLLICSSLLRSFAQIAQDKWANVSDSLRLLRTNEQLWANCSGRSWQMSECERFAQVTQDKWVNEQIARSFRANRSFYHLLPKIERFAQKNWKKSYFFMFFTVFWKFKKS